MFAGYPYILFEDRRKLWEFLDQEFCSKDLNQMANRLWWMSKQDSANISPLHRQLVKQRAVIVTEDPKLHLIWIHNRIFIKPLPRYIVSYAFWQDYMGGDGKDAHDIRRTALGHLRTWLYLPAPHPARHHMGPVCRFASDLTTIVNHDVPTRYTYGEIRLTRLNFYAPFQLLELIVETSQATCAKWLVSSRNWPQIEEELSNVAHRLSLEVNAKSVAAAVDSYILHKVSQLVQRKSYRDNTADEVRQYLSSNADGTFLWVALGTCEDTPRECFTESQVFPVGSRFPLSTDDTTSLRIGRRRALYTKAPNSTLSRRAISRISEAPGLSDNGRPSLGKIKPRSQAPLVNVVRETRDDAPSNLVPVADMGRSDLLRNNKVDDVTAHNATARPNAPSVDESLAKNTRKGKGKVPQGAEEDDREEHEIASLIKHRMAADGNGAVELLVGWAGEKAEDATWELEGEVQRNAEESLYTYWKTQQGRQNALFIKPKNPPPERYHVFKILNHREKSRGGFQFEVQWVGHPATRGETSMEAETKLKNVAPELLDGYWESVGGRASRMVRRGRTKKARTK
ncbi:Uu.00g136730.m01.CDS01 [Anthostomella pinea]|uniref:Uu.00g136730.m01.CDS01 n=1 Tax=Anthostomella pinea TaxID=933095 RepID=A0AAI8VPD5_9PEZI|nr:Uu.00g136730.m01.CDS01 [Anthostomella pinea]